MVKPTTFQAVERVRLLPLKLLALVKKTSGAVLAAAILAYFFKLVLLVLPRDAVNLILKLVSLRLPEPDGRIWDLILAAICFILPFWIVSALIIAFAEQKLMRAGKSLGNTVPENDSLLEYLDFEGAAFFRAAMKADHFPFARLLLYRILKSRRLTFAFKRLMISSEDIEKEVLKEMKEASKSFSRNSKDVLSKQNQMMREHILGQAARLSVANQEKKISVFTIFMALANEDEKFQAAMDRLRLLKEDVDSVVLWQMRMEFYKKFRSRFWERDNLRRFLVSSPAQMAIGGWTVLLDRFSRDIMSENPLKQGGVILHQQEIEILEEALIKKESNGVLLVGETGSGRKSIIYNLANRIAAENAPAALKMTRILELDMVAMIGAYPDKAVLAAALDQVFQEALRAKNVVLVIPQIHNYIGRGFGAEKVAAIDISGVIGGFLKKPGFRLIGIATYEGLHRSIEAAGEIAVMFRKIEVSRVVLADAMKVLKEEGLRRESANGIFIPIASLKEIVKLCDYFLGDEAFPRKAITLLDDLVANKLSRGKNTPKNILPEDVDAYFSHKYEVPAGAAGEKEKEILANLEDRIHEELVNQKEAVGELANALRRARAEIGKRKRTIGNFLFLGPTGVGKTETAKQLARVYFGSEKSMIRLNMAEYQTIESIGKLIGRTDEPGFLTTAVRENPFSLVLLDEIEKAHPGLLNIFLNVFDEGEMNDGVGRRVDFRHAIIIATSNAGAEYIKEAVERGSTLANMKNSIIDNLLRRNLFKPEFINRFDALVLYRPLGMEEVQKISNLVLQGISRDMKEKRIDLVITPELAQSIGVLGFDPAFGGRALRRVVQEKIENTLAKALLSGRIKAGDICEFDCQTWELLVGDERLANKNKKNEPETEEDPVVPILMSLEDRIHEGLINQKEAVVKLADALRRSYVNLKERKRTIGNFLFLGPTGVGKTETAKQLARVYFGSEKSMIRLNMAEYQNTNSIDKLIGNLETPGLLTSQVMEKPQSLILIDEIEKANPRILNLFLSVFDDGQLADGSGQAVDFKQSIIIATSNAGSEKIKEAMEMGLPMDSGFKKDLVNFLLGNGLFTPEFINRFDAVVLYRSLSREEMLAVTRLMLEDIKNGLAAKGIVFEIKDELVGALLDQDFDPVFGGRSVRRAIQDKIESGIAKALLSRTVRKGDSFTVDPKNWQLVIVPAPLKSANRPIDENGKLDL